MTKETSEEIAALASRYLNHCPVFRLVFENFYVETHEIRALAASCLAQREEPEPSISYRELREMIGNGVLVAPPKVIEALVNLIAEQEKESEK